MKNLLSYRFLVALPFLARACRQIVIPRFVEPFLNARYVRRLERVAYILQRIITSKRSEFRFGIDAPLQFLRERIRLERLRKPYPRGPLRYAVGWVARPWAWLALC